MDIEEEGLLEGPGGLEESLSSMSPSLIISTTSTWYRVWQITTLDDYSLSQRLAGEAALPQLRAGRERGRVKLTRVFSIASVYRTVVHTALKTLLSTTSKENGRE